MNKRFISGAAGLPTYGPMFWYMLEVILPALSPPIWKLFDSVKEEEDVDRALDKTFSRQATLMLVAFSFHLS